MLILECVELKKEYRGPKWGGLLPISSLGSRHCSGVEIRGTMACTAGAPARKNRGPPHALGRAWEGLS